MVLCVSVVERRFATQISSLLDKRIIVITTDGKRMEGTLLGVHLSTLSLCLGDVKDESGASVHRVFLSGNTLAQIRLAEKPFDLRGLAERLKKVFPPTLVRLYEDQGIIWVMDKVKVTERGVEEGTGAAAERVREIYEQFIKEKEKANP